MFVTDENEKRPLVISQHGGLGSPELCSSFDDSSNYNNMTRRILEQKVNVFAPQTLLWKAERTEELKYNRPEIDTALQQVVSSITAVEIYSIIKTLNYLCEKPYIDEDRIGMVALSYRGFYTLYTAAADKRIKSTLSCSHFNDRIKYNWKDRVWFDSASKFLDAEVALLACPRKLQIFVEDNDELFDPETAQKEYDRIKQYDKDADEWISFKIFVGVHEFYHHDDEPIKKLADELKNL